MSMKKSLILAESPLQLLNAYEAIKYFKLENYTLVVRFSQKKENDSQLATVLEKLSFEHGHIIKLSISSGKRQFVDYLKLFFVKGLSFFANYKYKTVYSGNYDSGFFRLIVGRFKCDDIFLLDDGNKSIRIQSEFNKDRFFHLFTMFDLQPFSGQKVVKNNYSSIRGLDDSSTSVDSTVLFLGSGMSEIGIVTELYYLHLISSISSHYKSHGIKVIYVPHRAEKDSKLEQIQLNDNLEIVKLNYPIELFGIYGDVKPTLISSFCSTAILTVKMIYDMEVECFHFDYESTPDKSELDDIYNYYEQCGIKVFRVDEYVA